MSNTKLYTTTGIHQLYYDALKADKAFHDALLADYGLDAGDMRYAAVLPSHLALLRIAKIEADERYLEAFRATITA